VLEIITPIWSVPENITAFCTTRKSGVSQQGYAGLNLATHVNDELEHVVQNRELVMQSLGLPSKPQWLEQTHSTHVVKIDEDINRNGDAAISHTPGRVVVVLTADCLPVLFCNNEGTEVAAAHAGWRGLLNGVLENTVSNMTSKSTDLHAWLGPAIGKECFEVGEEVQKAFVTNLDKCHVCFQQNRDGHYLADLYELARLRLKAIGINFISGGEYCTYSDSERFYSYRRENPCGRQATMIYINKNGSV